MKVYSVWTDVWDYDEYDEFIVVARDADTALEMVKDRFNGRQLPYINVDEIDLTKENVLLGSFNGV